MEAWSLTNKNLSERIGETERAKKLSMENLETTVQDLTNMDYNIKLLKKALEDKNPSKMVAESRLEVSSPCNIHILIKYDNGDNNDGQRDQVRSHRPGQEHCGDKAFVKLREEVSDFGPGDGLC